MMLARCKADERTRKIAVAMMAGSIRRPVTGCNDMLMTIFSERAEALVIKLQCECDRKGHDRR
jgi:hypothetical protein